MRHSVKSWITHNFAAGAPSNTWVAH